jgi:arylsulfatase A-like enzyme
MSEFLEWMNSTTDPWAACINLTDAHFPYRPKEEYDLWGGEKIAELHDEIGRDFIQSIGKRPWWQWEAVESLYDGTIHQLDSCLGKLIEKLKNKGAFEDTLIIVTSDHGEGFGEPDRIVPGLRIANHNYGIHEVLTHVPLVVKWPGQDTHSEVSDFAAVKEFPSAVDTALQGQRDNFVFVPDGPVYSATYRSTSINTTPKTTNREDYLGPWRAAYVQEDDRLLKFADRSDESAIIEIVDAQTSFRIGSDDEGRTNELFEPIEDEGMSKGTGEIDDTVEEKLADLGYLR